MTKEQLQKKIKRSKHFQYLGFASMLISLLSFGVYVNNATTLSELRDSYFSRVSIFFIVLALVFFLVAVVVQICYDPETGELETAEFMLLKLPWKKHQQDPLPGSTLRE